MAKTYKELAAEAFNAKRVADISIIFNKTVKPFNAGDDVCSSYNSETVDTVESFKEKVNKPIEKAIAERIEEEKKVTQ